MRVVRLFTHIRCYRWLDILLAWANTTICGDTDKRSFAADMRFHCVKPLTECFSLFASFMFVQQTLKIDICSCIWLTFALVSLFSLYIFFSLSFSLHLVIIYVRRAVEVMKNWISCLGLKWHCQRNDYIIIQYTVSLFLSAKSLANTCTPIPNHCFAISAYKLNKSSDENEMKY